MTAPSDITTYLASILGADSVRILPCYVTIGHTTYPAARYTQRLMTPENTPAWRAGKREYERETIYCVGFLPSCKLNRNVAFTIEGDANEWYITSYYGDVTGRKQSAKAPNQYHPFGNSFMLSPWDVPGGERIDHYARVPYRRVAMQVGL